MASSVITRNIIELSKNLQKNINFVDLSYKGMATDINGEKHATITGGTPILNQYKMWLQSKRMDYIRSPQYGGFFANNLNEYEFSPSSIPAIKSDIIKISKELFPTLEILDCQIECVVSQRKWKVKIVVGDSSTGLIGVDYDKDSTIEIETTSSVVD